MTHFSSQILTSGHLQWCTFHFLEWRTRLHRATFMAWIRFWKGLAVPWMMVRSKLEFGSKSSSLKISAQLLVLLSFSCVFFFGSGLGIQRVSVWAVTVLFGFPFNVLLLKPFVCVSLTLYLFCPLIPPCCCCLWQPKRLFIDSEPGTWLKCLSCLFALNPGGTANVVGLPPYLSCW